MGEYVGGAKLGGFDSWRCYRSVWTTAFDPADCGSSYGHRAVLDYVHDAIK
jgi:hypothetical protein